MPDTITQFIVIFALLCGTTLFIMGPRLATSFAHSHSAASKVLHLSIRWLHLFLIELVACMFLYTGLDTSGLLPALPPLTTSASIVSIAFLVSCMLAFYI